jgi:hypothetical protein
MKGPGKLVLVALCLVLCGFNLVCLVWCVVLKPCVKFQGLQQLARLTVYQTRYRVTVCINHRPNPPAHPPVTALSA